MTGAVIKERTERQLGYPGRPAVGLMTLLLVVLLLVIDAGQSVPIDPYLAPAPVALGSGLAPEGAHCTNLP